MFFKPINNVSHGSSTTFHILFHPPVLTYISRVTSVLVKVGDIIFAYYLFHLLIKILCY